jgi:hypothetical protein
LIRIAARQDWRRGLDGSIRILRLGLDLRDQRLNQCELLRGMARDVIPSHCDDLVVEIGGRHMLAEAVLRDYVGRFNRSVNAQSRRPGPEVVLLILHLACFVIRVQQLREPDRFLDLRGKQIAKN